MASIYNDDEEETGRQRMAMGEIESEEQNQERDLNTAYSRQQRLQNLKIKRLSCRPADSKGPPDFVPLDSDRVIKTRLFHVPGSSLGSRYYTVLYPKESVETCRSLVLCRQEM